MSGKLLKKKSISVNGKNFTFTPAGYEQDKAFDCTLVCQYAKICHLLPDPREPENKDKSFMTFCGELSEGDDFDECYIPQDGTIEENYSEDEDVVKKIIDSTATIRVKDIVDDFCSGFCDQYTADYHNCSSCNAGCIIANLLRNKNILTEEERMSLKEFNTTDKGAFKETDDKTTESTN